jgi:hypothetical protein
VRVPSVDAWSACGKCGETEVVMIVQSYLGPFSSQKRWPSGIVCLLIRQTAEADPTIENFPLRVIVKLV